jgi:DNA-binding XRE family transcriptional regulator
LARKQLARDPQLEPVRPSVVGLPRRGLPGSLLFPASTIRAASAALFSTSSSSLLPLRLRPSPRQLSEYGWRPIQPSAGFAGHLETGADGWQAGKRTTPVPGRACRSTWLLRRNGQAIASLVCIGLALGPWGNRHGRRRRPERQARDPDRHVGARIRERRITLGLSQQAFAQRIGVTHKQVGKYEQGTNGIAAGRLYQIARTLG